MHAPKACDVFCKLHAMHYSKSMIGRLTGYSSAYVGMVLSDLGHTERWHKPDDCRAALPQALRESCDHLMSARSARPIDPRKGAGDSTAGLNPAPPRHAAERRARSLSPACAACTHALGNALTR
jgi:hypothetical protein